MSEQPTLFDPVPGSIDERFMDFHEANPHVFERLVEKALWLRRRGWSKYSMKALVEVVRWESNLQTEDPSSDFKINNSYTSRYSRLVEAEVPELQDFFEKRRLRS